MADMKTIQMIAKMLEESGVEDDRIRALLASTVEKIRADQNEWEARPEVKQMRQMVAKLDDSAIRIAIVERELRREKINPVEVTERLEVIKNAVREQF